MHWPPRYVTGTEPEIFDKMYDYIRGTLISKRATEAVIDVNGVGYLLKISLSTSEALPAEGSETELKTYLHVREDILQLFGFAGEDERTIFSALISISGVGPKLAQTILSGLSPKKLVGAIRTADEQALNRISGVGKKTAQRLIVELKDKLAALPGTEPESEAPTVHLSELENEALMALLSLGYNRQRAEVAISKVQKQEKALTAEDLIKSSLQVI